MILVLIATAGLFLLIEQLWPARELPTVRRWWWRVLLVNVAQARVVFVAGHRRFPQTACEFLPSPNPFRSKSIRHRDNLTRGDLGRVGKQGSDVFLYEVCGYAIGFFLCFPGFINAD